MVLSDISRAGTQSRAMTEGWVVRERAGAESRTVRHVVVSWEQKQSSAVEARR